MPSPDPKALAQLIEQHLEIPTIPAVASRALREMSDPEVGAPKLARIIAEDQGLTARILKVSNSALYSVSREVKNLQQAAMLLGFETLKSIVISVSCRMMYKRFGPAEKALWSHAVGAAVTAHHLARARSLRVRDEAFVCGLMHDVGRVVMNNGAREKLEQAAALARAQGLDDADAEREVFGFTHVDVGAVLVNRWGLSKGLEQAVFLHHEPELAPSLAEGNEELVYLTALANHVAHAFGVGGPRREVPVDDHPCAAELGFGEGELEKLRPQLLGGFEAEHGALA